jgi:hypothetical protein
MRTTVIRFAAILLLISLGIYFFNQSKKTPQNTLINNVLVQKAGENTSDGTIAFDSVAPKLDKWLSEIPLKSLSKDDCQEVEKVNFEDKESLQTFIEDLIFFSFKDKYLVVHAKNRSFSPSNLFALFDNQDNLQAFKYELCETVPTYTYAPPRLEDWNKDGQVELIMDANEDKANYKKETSKDILEFWDFTSVENQIIKIFEYEKTDYYFDRYSFIEYNRVNQIEFEESNTFKFRSKFTNTVHQIEKIDDGYGLEAYEDRVKVQKISIAQKLSDSTSVEYYQRDKTTQIFVKKN